MATPTPDPWEFRFRARLPDVRDFPRPVIDGDGCWLQADRGTRIKVDMNLRLDQVRAPERNTPEAWAKARAFVEGWLILHAHYQRWPWQVQTDLVRDETHEVTTLERYVAVVICRSCGANLNSEAETYYRAAGYPTGN